MRNALQDQLLKAGLVKEKQVKEAHKSRQHAQRQQPGKQPQKSEVRQEATAAQLQKSARDKALNAERSDRTGVFR